MKGLLELAGEAEQAALLIQATYGLCEGVVAGETNWHYVLRAERGLLVPGRNDVVLSVRLGGLLIESRVASRPEAIVACPVWIGHARSRWCGLP